MKNELEIFLFVDALGWDMVSSRHYLEDLFPERRGVEMQFGYSCSAIPTILSGTRPDRNGHLGLFRFAPEASPFKKFKILKTILKPASFWNRGRVRNWVSKAVKRFCGFTGYFQLYQVAFDRIGYMDYAEKQDLFVRGGLGSIPNLCDTLVEAGIPFHISDWHLGDMRAFRAGIDAIRGGARFLFLYACEFDAILHDHIRDTDDSAIRAKLDWYRTRIEEVFAAARETGRPFRFTLFSDHGMTPLTKTIDIKNPVEATGLVFGVDYGACYDSTLFRVTFLKDGAREKIMKAVEPFRNDGHWLTDDEQKNYGIYREDHAFGDAIFLVNPGIQIIPSDMGSRPLNGMHGFEPNDRYSRAAVLSTQPIPDNVRSVADYFRLMTDALRD